MANPAKAPLHNWESEPATQSQLSYITSRNMVPREQLRGITKGQAFNIIREWREAASTKEAGLGELASDAQVNYIKKLCSVLGENAGQFFIDGDGKIPKKKASQTITELKSRLDAPIETEEGLYVVGTNVYKVKKSNWGHLNCYRLVKLDNPEYISNGVRTYKFVEDSSMIRALSKVPLMTREQAQEFAQETSCCVRCGIQLDPNITNEDGTKRWIGPICATKMGW
jgi:hypothetical protein